MSPDIRTFVNCKELLGYILSPLPKCLYLLIHQMDDEESKVLPKSAHEWEYLLAEAREYFGDRTVAAIR
eukprot:631503-Pyramimonas_sp.AAC.1